MQDKCFKSQEIIERDGSYTVLGISDAGGTSLSQLHIILKVPKDTAYIER